jgi:cellobiose transport system substrate-binding protein
MPPDAPTQALKRRKFLQMVGAGGSALGLSAALAACGLPLGEQPAPPATPQPQTILLWSWVEDAADPIVKSFEQQYPTITVKVEQMGYDQAHGQLARALEAGSGAPDVFITDLNSLAMLREQSGLADLAGPPFDGAVLKDSMIPTLWGYGTHQGRQVALPWIVGLGLAWYRPAVFEAAGLPTDPGAVRDAAASWDEWLGFDAVLRRRSPESFLVAGAQELFGVRVEQQGHGWLEEGRLLVASKGTPAAELVQTARARDIPIEISGSEYARGMIEGHLAGMVNASWMQFFLLRDFAKTAGSWRVTRAPGGDYIAGAMFLVIPQQSQRQEAAWIFAKHLCASVEGQNTTFQATGAFPAYSPAWSDTIYTRPVEFFGGQPAYQVMAQAAAALPPGTVSVHDRQIDVIVQREMARVANKSKDAAQAMADAEAAVRKEIPNLASS